MKDKNLKKWCKNCGKEIGKPGSIHIAGTVCLCQPKQPVKDCENCDYDNAVRQGRADWRCPKCGRKLMLEMVLMKKAEEKTAAEKYPPYPGYTEEEFELQVKRNESCHIPIPAEYCAVCRIKHTPPPSDWSERYDKMADKIKEVNRRETPDWEREFDGRFVDLKISTDIAPNGWWQTDYDYIENAVPEKVKQFIRQVEQTARDEGYEAGCSYGKRIAQEAYERGKKENTTIINIPEGTKTVTLPDARTNQEFIIKNKSNHKLIIQ